MLTNAFPVKMTVTDMKSDGDEIAVESIELVQKGLSIASLMTKFATKKLWQKLRKNG